MDRFGGKGSCGRGGIGIMKPSAKAVDPKIKIRVKVNIYALFMIDLLSRLKVQNSRFNINSTLYTSHEKKYSR